MEKSRKEILYNQIFLNLQKYKVVLFQFLLQFSNELKKMLYRSIHLMLAFPSLSVKVRIFFLSLTYIFLANKTDAATALDGWVDATDDGDNETLPDPFYDAVCPSFEFLTEYLVYLALNLTELGETVSLSGDNTKVITNAQTSTDTLIKPIGCFK